MRVSFPVPPEWWRDANRDGRLRWFDLARRSRGLRGMAFKVGRSEIARLRLSRPVFGRCSIIAWVRYPPTAHRADPANAAPTVKPIIDGLTDAGFWVDDDSSHVVAVAYMRGPDPAPPSQHIITLDIKETKGGSHA